MKIRKFTKLDNEYSMVIKYHYVGGVIEYILELFKNNSTIGMYAGNFKTCKELHKSIVTSFNESRNYFEFKLKISRNLSMFF